MNNPSADPAPEEWPIEIREYAKPEDPTTKDDDRSFFTDLWSKAYRRSRWAGTIPNNLFHDVFRVTLEGLERRGLKVALAHVPGRPDALMGFVAYEQKQGDLPHVAFVGVKDPFRRGRVASKLLHHTVGHNFRYSFRTEHARFFMASGRWAASYAPEITRRKDL